MEQDELKRKLFGLWEKTTHSSKEFLSLLFDYYFDRDLIIYKESDGKIVSALCGVPYSFGYGKMKLNGLYLIPLSSEEGFRKKGILSEMIEEFNDNIRNSYDFTFLVPTTELMADYYGTMGYLSSFYILEERFTSLHDFKNDYLLSLSDSDERIRNLKVGLMDEIKVTEFVYPDLDLKINLIDFIQEIEAKGNSATNLNHTSKDLDYLLQDDSLSQLMVYIAKDSDNKISGVAFVQKDDTSRLKVVATFTSDICSYYSLLDFIKKQWSGYSISVITSENKYQVHSLVQQNYASSNPLGGDLDNTFSTIEIPFNLNRLLQPLGMVKILRYENIFRYIAETRSDAEFTLQIRDYTIMDKVKDNNSLTDKEIFIVKNGELKIDSIENFKNRNSILNLSKKEISELLLRKNDSSNLIMEAFSIPRLDLQIKLLPY